MTEEEAAELEELRRRIYGPDSTAAVTETDLKRLRSLESGGAGSDAGDVPGRLPNGDAQFGAPVESEQTPVSAHSAKRRLWRFWVAAIAAGLALTAVGFASGVMLTAPQAPEALPEFTFDQTDEDVLPQTFFAEDDLLDPGSTRFVGRVDGYVIFLARNAQFDGVCILAVTDDPEPAPVSMGCAGGPITSGGGVSFGVTEALEVGVGDRSPNSRGAPIRLSESVTAYRS